MPMMAVQPPHPGGAVRKPDKVQPLPAHMIERLPSFLLEKTALVRRRCIFGKACAAICVKASMCATVLRKRRDSQQITPTIIVHGGSVVMPGVVCLNRLRSRSAASARRTWRTPRCGMHVLEMVQRPSMQNAFC